MQCPELALTIETTPYLLGTVSANPDHRSMRYSQPRRALLHLHIFSRTPPQTLRTRVAAVWGNMRKLLDTAARSVTEMDPTGPPRHGKFN